MRRRDNKIYSVQPILLNIRPGKLDSQFIVPARTLFREIPKYFIFHYN